MSDQTQAGWEPVTRVFGRPVDPTVTAEVEPEQHVSGRVAYRLRIGVTGHRELPEDPLLLDAVRLALGRARALFPSSETTPVRLAVVSPLAQGADRLMAREVLTVPDAILEASLPFEVDEYLKDFESEDSRREFEDLLDRAEVVSVHNGRGADDYGRVGRYVADYCDILVALWDGEPSTKPGGTALTVEYAVSRGYPVIWVEINPPYRVRESLPTEPFLQVFRQFEHHNRPAPKRLHRDIAARIGELIASAYAEGVPPDQIRPFAEWIIPYYVRADSVAERAQARFRYLSLLLFFAGAGAVAASAAQLIFAPDRPLYSLVEVGLLVFALLALFVGRRRKIHDRWLSTRFLAERFRSALFRAMAGDGSGQHAATTRNPVPAVGDFRLEHSADEWVRRAYDEVWRSRPRDTRSRFTEGLKRLITNSWLEDQVGWYERTASKHEKRHRILVVTSYVLFATTLLAALLHASGLEGGGPEGAAGWTDLLGFVGLVFPAFAGAVAGLHAQRQYERNSVRYSRIARRLSNIQERLRTAENHEVVLSAVQEAEAAMLDENIEWFGTMRFEDLKPQA